MLVFLMALFVSVVGMLPTVANNIVFAEVIPSGYTRLILPIAALLIGVSVATEEDAWRAAEIAGIAEDIREMPMGIQTIVSEDSGWKHDPIRGNKYS